ncbi:hypothetical protein Tco_0913575 [Tanacetum coccineum]
MDQDSAHMVAASKVPMLKPGQPNSPQLDNEDLQQIHPDDLEEMDLRCRCYANNGGQDILEDTGRRECSALKEPRNQEYGKKQEGLCSRDNTSNALLSSDGICSNSKISTDSNCSSSCLENVKILKEQNEQLLKDLRTS